MEKFNRPQEALSFNRLKKLFSEAWQKVALGT
jgi:hypothetical protein